MPLQSNGRKGYCIVRFHDLTGEQFGKLTVLKKDESKGNDRIKWLCLCECGNTKTIRGSDLRSGKIKSCGCARIKGNHRTHNMTNTRIYRIWCNVKSRCTNSNIKQYKDYGGRGITVCDEWLNSFEAFYDWSIANGYAENLTIERIDVNGNYEPSNCKWATTKEQSLNRTDNHKLTCEGETKTIAEWSEITGIHRSTIESRLKAGLTIEQALSKAP